MDEWTHGRTDRISILWTFPVNNTLIGKPFASETIDGISVERISVPTNIAEHCSMKNATTIRRGLNIKVS